MNKQIKIIEGMSNGDVMNAYEQMFQPLAYRQRGSEDWVKTSYPLWDWYTYEYAIIAPSLPPINWNDVDWGFFNQYGGVPLLYNGLPMKENQTWDSSNDVTFATSPYYYWPGGECPLTVSVEVEVILRGGDTLTLEAEGVNWGTTLNSLRQVIAFKLTGRISE